MNQKNKFDTFYRYSFFVTLSTLFLIFIGGLVRVAGAGMGCPDWPKCYGLWIPPISIMDVPPSYDTASFNAVLTWIEYVNRLAGALYGFLMIGLVVMVYRTFGFRNKIALSVVGVLFLTGLQGWIGKVVVDTDLKPFVVTIHLIVALIVLFIMIYITHLSHYARSSTEKKEYIFPPLISTLVLLLFVAGVIQILFGTHVREKLELFTKLFPLSTEKEWIGKLGGSIYIHAFWGISLVILTWIVGYQILSKTNNPFWHQVVYDIMGLTWAQLLIGISLVIIGIPAFMQLFHQWISSIYLALTFLLYRDIKTNLQKT